MSCGDGVERGVATCICKGQTVFDGAVIGQVFTGDVRIQWTMPALDPSVLPRRTVLQTVRTAVVHALAIWHLISTSLVPLMAEERRCEDPRSEMYRVSALTQPPLPVLQASEQQKNNGE